MRRLLAITAASIALAGCSLNGMTPAEQEMYGGSATLTGVIKLPEGTSTDVCDRMALRAYSVDAPEKSVGQVAVRKSRNRCSYTITRLPSDAPVAVDLKASVPSCDGGDLTITPAVQPIQLAAGEGRTADFEAACATASGAQPTPNAG